MGALLCAISTFLVLIHRSDIAILPYTKRWVCYCVQYQRIDRSGELLQHPIDGCGIVSNTNTLSKCEVRLKCVIVCNINTSDQLLQCRRDECVIVCNINTIVCNTQLPCRRPYSKVSSTLLWLIAPITGRYWIHAKTHLPRINSKPNPIYYAKTTFSRINSKPLC